MLYDSFMNGKDLLRLLHQNGWVLDRIEGSHRIMVKEGHRPVPVPVHGSKDLPKGLARRI